MVNNSLGLGGLLGMAYIEGLQALLKDVLQEHTTNFFSKQIINLEI